MADQFLTSVYSWTRIRDSLTTVLTLLSDPRTPGGTPGNSWWDVPLGSPNPDPISDQKMNFSTSVFRLDL